MASITGLGAVQNRKSRIVPRETDFVNVSYCNRSRVFVLRFSPNGHDVADLRLPPVHLELYTPCERRNCRELQRAFSRAELQRQRLESKATEEAVNLCL